MALEGKTIVVTGAASGIGAATARALTAAGATVVGLDRQPIPDFPGQSVQADLSTLAGVEAAAAAIAGPIDAIANIAGVPGTAPWETVLAVNVFGLRDLTELLLPQLVDGGVVVNLASNVANGWAARADLVREFVAAGRDAALAMAQADPEITGNSYRFSKECVRWFTLDQAARHLGRARFVSVSPGPVDTPILADFKQDHGVAKVEGAMALVGRAGRPDDIAAVVRFLVDEGAAWVNGTDVCVDGGLSAHRATQPAVTA